MVPTLNIPNAAAPVDPTETLDKYIKELEVTEVVLTMAVPPTKVTLPNEFATAAVVVPTFALKILLPEVTKFKFPVTFTPPVPEFKLTAALDAA